MEMPGITSMNPKKNKLTKLNILALLVMQPCMSRSSKDWVKERGIDLSLPESAEDDALLPV